MEAKTTLFRRAALQARADSLHGSPLDAGAPPTVWLVAGVVLASLLLLAFTGATHYTRKAHVSGFLAPTRGLIKVFTPQAGTVLERRVGEGQAVRRGDVLMVVTSEHATESAADAQAMVLARLDERRDSLRREQAKQEQIDALAQEAAGRRVQSLQDEIVQAQGQVQLQRQRVAGAQTVVERYRDLVASHFMADASLRQKQDELIEQQGQLASLQRSIASLQRDLDAARNEVASGGLRRANNAAQFDRQVSEIAQQRTEADSRRTVVLTATADGTVTTILAEPGQQVGPATPLLSILPGGAALEAQLLVPTRAAGFIRPGQAVALRYRAFPYERFGHHTGQVLRVGRSVIQPGEIAAPVTLDEPVYRVTVALPSQQVLAYGEPMALQAGMAVDADIRIDRRRVVEWLFDPLLAVAGRL